MKRCFLALFALAAVFVVCAQSLEQTAGIYYAYPGPKSQPTAAPDGYKPFYISHYGRHGSRWVTDDYRYTDVLALFDSVANLTPLGVDVRNRLQRVTTDALGRSGSLSPIGERQHAGIARRMIGSYPDVFTDSASVTAVSSTSLRCAMSMAAFTESLKEVNPSLRVSRTAHERDMQYIAYNSDAAKAFSGKDGPWRERYWQFVAENVKPERLVATLFVDPSALTEQQCFDLATGLYWIASDMQDVELDEQFYDIFTYDELRSMWRCINARMYICNGNATEADSLMIHCADNLLNNIISCADAALRDGSTAANLRFGHDTHLLRLLALMGIDGCSSEAADMPLFETVWRDYELSPMAANLQLVFFKNADDDVIVKILLNENDATVPIQQVAPNFYRWNVLRDYLIAKLSPAS